MGRSIKQAHNGVVECGRRHAPDFNPPPPPPSPPPSPGLHYDALAVAAFHGAPESQDVTRLPSSGPRCEAVMAGAAALTEAAHKARQFTDTANFTLRCAAVPCCSVALLSLGEPSWPCVPLLLLPLPPRPHLLVLCCRCLLCSLAGPPPGPACVQVRRVPDWAQGGEGGGGARQDLGAHQLQRILTGWLAGAVLLPTLRKCSDTRGFCVVCLTHVPHSHLNLGGMVQRATCNARLQNHVSVSQPMGRGGWVLGLRLLRRMRWWSNAELEHLPALMQYGTRCASRTLAHHRAPTTLSLRFCSLLSTGVPTLCVSIKKSLTSTYHYTVAATSPGHATGGRKEAGRKS